MASLEARVTAIEKRQAWEARVAASRDQDLADLQVVVRSHTGMLQAVQNRQAEHTAILNEHSAILNEHSTRLDRVEDRLGRLEVLTVEGFAAIGSQLQVLIDRDGGGEAGQPKR